MSNVKYKIIFENDFFLVINKPANVNFHDEDSAGNGIFNQVKSQGNYPQLYPVHRIDKMTSGLLLFAKTKEAASEFGNLFSQHLIEKYYLAISLDKPKKKQGWIKGDMVKSRRSAWRLDRTMNNPAISQFFSYSISEGVRLFLVKPLTGKTHQIRVALNSIGSSISGDPIYNPSHNIDRGYLHAYALRFCLFGEDYQFVERPNEGELFLNRQCLTKLNELQTPWQLPWPKHNK